VRKDLLPINTEKYSESRAERLRADEEWKWQSGKSCTILYCCIEINKIICYYTSVEVSV
jgi:hypothetical protein